MKLKFLFFAFSLCNVLYAQKSKAQELDSIFVYREKIRGGTTANMWSKHDELINNQTPVQKLNKSDLLEFNKKLNSVNSKKLWQQKYGGENYFLVAYENGVRNNYVIGSGTEFLIVDNLSKMRRRLIPKQNVEMLIELLERNCR